MKLEQGIEGEPTEAVLNLGQVAAGQLFRFAHISYEDALREELFYMPTKTTQKEGRVEIVNPENGEVLRRDDSQRVVLHTSVLSVFR